MSGAGFSARVQLERHPDFGCDAVTCIEVEVARAPSGVLTLRYRALGAVEGLLLPPAATPARRDELWRHTCFELFVGVPGSGYLEFNFSPSGEWAAYGFSGYRIGMRDLEIAPPVIEAGFDTEGYALGVSVSPGELAEPWRIGLSAIIEEHGGAKSYWAVAHPPGKPDFHHPDCFALEL